jgi:multiple sugar transport system substrate-binding protein
MIKSKIVLLSALVSCALISGCKEENKTNVSIEFMHSSVEQERQAVISQLIARFEKENPGITVKQVPVEEDAYNTKVITLSRSGSLPEVIETSHDYAKVMDKEQLIDRLAVATVISNVGEGAFYDGVLRIVRTEDGSAWTGVPVSAWIGGIWYRKDVLAKAGLDEPKNWQQLLDVAQKLNDPANKKYGIALPTAESVLTEQSFSQFALSNQANVFNAEGKITLDTPETFVLFSSLQPEIRAQETSERAVLRRRNSRLKNIATASPSTVLPATTSAVYQTVIHSECQKPGSERIRT